MPPVLTESDIEKLVHAFYASVRKDSLLAPIFATKIEPDTWPAHMSHISDFWGSIFLKNKSFSGNPMQKHLAIDGLTPSHFERWLSLFRISADQTLSVEKADMVHAMATRIAQSLQMGLAFNLEKSGAADNPFSNFGLRSSLRKS